MRNKHDDPPPPPPVFGFLEKSWSLPYYDKFDKICPGEHFGRECS